MFGQNLSLELDILGENQLYYVHSSRKGNWTSVNKRYSFVMSLEMNCDIDGSKWGIRFDPIESKDVIIKQ